MFCCVALLVLAGVIQLNEICLLQVLLDTWEQVPL